MPSGFPYFLQFKPEFCNKELMIWATVSFRSCFCWLYRVYPSSSAKNIINLILVLTTWWYPCVESSPVWWKRVFAMTSVFCGNTLLEFVLLHFLLQGQTCLLLSISVNFLLLHSYHSWWKWYLFFLVLVQEDLTSLHKTSQLQLLQHQCLGHGLGLLWFWMVCLEMNQDHSLIFEIAIKYWNLDSCWGLLHFSKIFLPKVVDKMVIWIKFTPSCSFQFTDS